MTDLTEDQERALIEALESKDIEPLQRLGLCDADGYLTITGRLLDQAMKEAARANTNNERAQTIVQELRAQLEFAQAQERWVTEWKEGDFPEARLIVLRGEDVTDETHDGYARWNGVKHNKPDGVLCRANGEAVRVP